MNYKKFNFWIKSLATIAVSVVVSFLLTSSLWVTLNSKLFPVFLHSLGIFRSTGVEWDRLFHPDKTRRVLDSEGCTVHRAKDKTGRSTEPIRGTRMWHESGFTVLGRGVMAVVMRSAVSFLIVSSSVYKRRGENTDTGCCLSICSSCNLCRSIANASVMLLNAWWPFDGGRSEF